MQSSQKRTAVKKNTNSISLNCLIISLLLQAGVFYFFILKRNSLLCKIQNLDFYWLTRYLSEDTLTSMRSSPTRTFSPSDLCLDAGWMVHQHASPEPYTENINRRKFFMLHHMLDSSSVTVKITKTKLYYNYKIIIFWIKDKNYYNVFVWKGPTLNTCFVLLQTNIKSQLVGWRLRWRQAAKILGVKKQQIYSILQWTYEWKII